MKNVLIRVMVHATTYDELMDKAEQQLTDFTNIDRSEFNTKFNADYNIYLSSDDGISSPIYTAEVIARLRNHGQS